MSFIAKRKLKKSINAKSIKAFPHPPTSSHVFIIIHRDLVHIQKRSSTRFAGNVDDIMSIAEPVESSG